MNLLTTIRQIVDPIKSRVLLMISRAVLTQIMDDKKIQLVQINVLKDETLDAVERFQNFGFTSHPKAGAEAILACVGGNRNHPIIIAVDDRRYRKKNLSAGEAAVYNSEGDYIWIKADGSIEIKASGTVTLDAPNVHMTGTLTVDGIITATGGVTAPGGVSVVGAPAAGELTDGEGTLDEIRSVYNSHHHPQSGGGTTSPPTEQMT